VVLSVVGLQCSWDSSTVTQASVGCLWMVTGSAEATAVSETLLAGIRPNFHLPSVLAYSGFTHGTTSTGTVPCSRETAAAPADGGRDFLMALAGRGRTSMGTTPSAGGGSNRVTIWC